MTDMILPDWIVDDVLSAADASVMRVVLALYRHGCEQTAADGSPRQYWRGTRTELARLTRQTKQASDAALQQLEQNAHLTLHVSPKKAPVLSFSMLTETAHRSPIMRPSESETACIHDGDDLSILPIPDEDLEITTTTMSREELIARLQSEGVSSPIGWLAKYGQPRIEAALDRLDEQNERDEEAAGQVQHYGEATTVRYSITNPPGFLYRLLERRTRRASGQYNARP